MMEADIIQIDVLKWTGHHRDGNKSFVSKETNKFVLGDVIIIFNIRMMSP